MTTTPHIEKLKWADIRSVLPHEAIDFTPWMADNLDLLAEVLGLEDLVLVGTEVAVEEFRLDILATGADASDSEISVVVENQYGITDHDHLGKLITYAAWAEQDSDRVIGVWVVETPRAAHLAAVEFLNRMSNGTVGWFLVSPRFVPGPSGFFVHFEKHAEPNEFLRVGTRTGKAQVAPERVEFMQSVFDHADQPLRTAGFRHVWVHPEGTLLRAYLPSSFPATKWAEVRASTSKNRFRVSLLVNGGRHVPKELNGEVLEGIKQRHGDAIQDALGADAPPVEWHVATGTNDRSSFARLTWEDGYVDGDPNVAAMRLVDVAAIFFERLRGDGADEFPDPDEFEDTSAKADAPTVMSIAKHVQPGEWTTYGDLSTVASGQTSAAIAIGNMARNNPDFPNPHRVLNSKGEVPAGWVTSDGGGPEVARTRLEGEGLAFLPNGTADPTSRVPVDELRKRWQATPQSASLPVSAEQHRTP